MAPSLLIVESPTKARTLSGFLGSRYRVVASVGHVRDLPNNASEVPKATKGKEWGPLGVDIENDFQPYYVVSPKRKDTIRDIKAALKGAPELFLATDPDREGESISWHLLELLKPKVPVRRIVFHEITEDAVLDAIQHSRVLDRNLVDAQESRRILDRLFGYKVSPVLWKRVAPKLSAGRVQSVAVRLVVDREEERKAFRKAGFWNLEATLSGEGREFTATLVRIDGKRVAVGKDFDAATGKPGNGSVTVLDGPGSAALAETLRGTIPWEVTGVEEKPVTQHPAAPFTTSTLQQEANRKLGFSADRTMSAAQKLFDSGLISYHRTDSTTLSDKALQESGRTIRGMYGDAYYGGPRLYKKKVKNAQEAHEAIRPTDFEMAPDKTESRFHGDEAKLYELIWKRTVASQMADAKLLRTTVEITAAGEGDAPCVFTASGKVIQFPGYLRAYVEGSDDPAADLGDRETLLPACRKGDFVSLPGDAAALTLLDLSPKSHETTPPPRYTDASLVKRLEDDGIGRPSTYASIIKTILDRGYVWRQGKALVPTFTAFVVTLFLKEHFRTLVELDFTGRIEEKLDLISNGDLERLAFLREFYFGDGQEWPGLNAMIEKGRDQWGDYPSYPLGEDPDTKERIVIKIGRYGPYVQRGDGGEGNTASLPAGITPADFGLDEALALLTTKGAGPRIVGVDPKSGMTVYAMTGRFGPYVQLGETPEKVKKGTKRPKGSKSPKPPKPRRASFPKGETVEGITLETALRLLSLPREIGLHPEDAVPVESNFGRFGPYVKHGDDFRSLDSEEQVFAITLDEAVELLRKPKRARKRPFGAAKAAPLKELGANPAGVVIKVFDGRYGPYITDGAVNATVPKGVALESITLENALELLTEKAAKGPSKRRAKR
ncbi:MAG: type I DNA topoisomerase [Deltaproteobacteria bacterium]|nr:type I DNA topoisomerase [Deltaproteobacteria bacterium]